MLLCGNFKTSAISLFYAFWLLMLTLPVAADEIVIVAGVGVATASMTRDQVADLYLGKSQNKLNLTPYDQAEVELRENFYRQVTGLSAASVRAYWAKRVFSGRGRPPAIRNAAELTQLIENDPTAVSYFRIQQQPETAKILFSTSGDVE